VEHIYEKILCKKGCISQIRLYFSILLSFHRMFEKNQSIFRNASYQQKFFQFQYFPIEIIKTKDVLVSEHLFLQI